MSEEKKQPTHTSLRLNSRLRERAEQTIIQKGFSTISEYAQFLIMKDVEEHDKDQLDRKRLGFN